MLGIILRMLIFKRHYSNMANVSRVHRAGDRFRVSVKSHEGPGCVGDLLEDL